MRNLDEAKESFFDILAVTRKNSLILPNPSMRGLQAFLMGYQVCLASRGLIPRHVMEFDQFQGEWLARRLGLPFPNAIGWAGMMTQCVDGEYEAIRRFFELMDEFCSEHQIVVTALPSQQITK